MAWSKIGASAAAGRPSGRPQKNETVILVIYGCFWLFLVKIFNITNCIKTGCVGFVALQTWRPWILRPVVQKLHQQPRGTLGPAKP
jgi:hypothetical protein